MEKLLLIAIPDTAGVEQIAAKLRLRTVTVAPENYGKSLGSLGRLCRRNGSGVR